MARDIVINTGSNQKLVTSLSQVGARFLVIGSTAVRFHVPERRDEPSDLDLLLEPSVENGRKVIDAWRRADGPNIIAFTPSDFARPNVQFRDTTRPPYFNVDILTPPAEFDFHEAWRKAEEAVLAHPRTGVRVASVPTLLTLLRHARDRELALVRKYERDIELLEQQRG